MSTDCKNKARRISKLSDNVINRISAGEVIIKPYNAVKELIENSIDSGCKKIDIWISEGGTKYIEVVDDGTGVSREEFPMLCERFATSKLELFEDLENIETFGFRGEALASMSQVGRVTIMSKQKEDDVGYKGFFLNGVMVSSWSKNEKNVNSGIDVIMNEGTRVIIEDLFYNIITRRCNEKQELARIIDVVARYSLCFEKISFCVWEYSNEKPLLMIDKNKSIEEKVRESFGILKIEKLHRLDIEGKQEMNEDDVSNYYDKYGLVSISGYVSNMNHKIQKKVDPIFFVNNRLVSCNSLKKSVLSVYEIFLQKNSHPFILLSLKIKPENVDVNVHPTKKEVFFLFEDKINHLVKSKIYKYLDESENSRVLKTECLVNLSSNRKAQVLRLNSDKKKSKRDSLLVRSDPNQTKIKNLNFSKKNLSTFFCPQNDDLLSSDSENKKLNFDVSNLEKNLILKSIDKLKQKIFDSKCDRLSSIFKSSSYIGISDYERRFCCFQSGTKLFLCDYSSVLSEFFYQSLLKNFSHQNIFQLNNSICLDDLLNSLYSTIYIESLIQKKVILDLLFEKKNYLMEYAISLLKKNNKLYLDSLPLLFDEIFPSTSKLPLLFYNIAFILMHDFHEYNFEPILKQLAFLYIPDPIFNLTDCDNNVNEKKNNLNHILEHCFFPLFKSNFTPTKFLENYISQLADLPDLYRIFERC